MSLKSRSSLLLDDKSLFIAPITMLKAQVDQTNPEFVFQEEQFCCLRVSLTVYTLDSLLRAAYKFTDKCYIHIEPIDKEVVLIRLKARRPDFNASELAHELCNELLDQALRRTIAEETEPVRNLIMAHAFSKTALIEPELETADYSEDPAQIGKQDGKG